MSGLNNAERAQRWFEETRRLHMGQNPDLHKVVAGYRKSLEFQPDNPVVVYHLGLALLGRREFTNAEEQLRKALRLKADFPEAWFHLGQTLLQLRRPEEAEQAYRKAVELTPKEQRGPLYFTLAAALQSQYDALAGRDKGKAEAKLKQAEECYRLGLEQRPDDPQGNFQFALFLQNLSQLPGHEDSLDEAERLLDAVLEKQPDQRDVLNLRALLHSRRGRFDLACATLEKALAGSPDDAGLLFNLAQMCESAGDHAAARTHLEHSLAVQPRQPGALSRLAGIIAQHDRDWDKALDLIAKGMELAPRDPVLVYQKALVFTERATDLPEAEREAALAEARQLAELTLELQPGFPPGLALLARLGGQAPAAAAPGAPAVDVEEALRRHQAAPGDAEARQTAIQALISVRRFEEALPLLEAALEADPDDRASRVNHGLVLSYTAGQDGQKVLAARESLRKGIAGTQTPDSPILLRLAQLDLMLREPEEAMDLLAELRGRAAEDKRLDEAQLFQLSGVAAQQKGRLDEAATFYGQAADLLEARLPGGGALVENALRESTGSLAQVLDQLRRDDEAAAAWERYHRAAPQEGNALFRLSQVHNRNRRFEQGLETLRKLEQLAPDNPVTQYYLALTLTDLERHAEAEACLQKALELKPDFPEAQQRLQFLQQNRPLVAASLEELEASVAADPEDLDDRLLLGQAYVAARQWEKAAEQLEAVVKGDVEKKNHRALFDLSQVWVAAGDREKAIDCLVQLEERLPSDPGVRYRLAELLLDNDEEELAVKEFRNAVDMQPNNPVFQFRYGVALKAADHEDKAEKAIRRALELQATFPAAHFELGLLEFTSERWEAALQSFVTSYQQDSRNHMALYYCGLIQAKARQDRKEAAKFFQSALGIQPTHADSHFQLGSLFLAEGRGADAAWHLRKALELWPEDAFNRDLAEDLLAKAGA